MCFIIVLATFFSNQTKSKLIYASFTFTFFVLDFVARCQYHQTKYTFWGFIFFLWFFVCYISYIILFFYNILHSVLIVILIRLSKKLGVEALLNILYDLKNHHNIIVFLYTDWEIKLGIFRGCWIKES